MRRALGRLLGVVLTFALVSVIALAALSQLAAAFGDRAGRATRLPLYFNPQPSNVHDRAELALLAIASGKNSAGAERELARLGGASLPHVLPELDSLAPAARMRVALALVPVAERMGIASPAELSTGEKAAAFWERFWQDHEFDFRPQLVRRVVDRLAERASPLARDEIVRLDTYALPEMIAALARIRTPDDVARARRLTLLLAHVTGHGPVVDDRATVAEARSVTRFWRRFMVEEGTDFMTLDGPTRLVAMFAQTVYGRWLGRFFGVVRIGQERQPALGMSPPIAIGSAVRYLAAVIAALGLAVAWAAWEARARPALARLSRAAATLVVALPAVLAAALLGAPEGAWARSALAVTLTAILGAATLSRLELASSMERRFTSRPPIGVAVSGVLRATPSALPWIASSLFALELCVGIDGAARATIEGLMRADVSAGMTIALAGALMAAAIAALADAAIVWSYATEHRPVLVEVGARRRSLWVAALATGLVLAIFGAGWSTNASSGPPGWPEVAQGARGLLGYGVVATACAAVTGLVLGTLSASGARALDAVLVRCIELGAALPAALWAAALTQALGPGILAAVALGALRGIDVAWMLRSELLNRAQMDEERLSSVGRYSLWLYYERHLRRALLPALCVLAVTPAWWVALGTVGRLMESPSLPGGRGWDALLGPVMDARPVPSGVAFALLALVSGVLLAFVTAPPRRVGAFRASSVPPPPVKFAETDETTLP